MQLNLRELWQYAESVSTPEEQLLQDLIRETNLTKMMPQMICGRVIGQVLALFSTLQQPKQVLEIGTYTGYSTIQLAKGLQVGGQVHSYELNEEMDDIHERFFERAGIREQVSVHYGDAVALLPEMDTKFDLVFVDADKSQYPAYYELIAPRMNPGALLIADNVLWDGKVIDPEANDAETLGVRQFNRMVNADPKMVNVLMPMMDGLMLARRL